MSESARYMDLPFSEAIAFFRKKLNVSTEAWDDLWKEMHGQAFSVAGAMEEELLDDLRAAVDKAIADGTTLAEFREDFTGIVDRHGWDYNGGPAWRTAIIYNTNLAVAYQRGHWKQMTDPDVLKVRPYLRYVPSSSAEPRPEHLEWANLVLPADDPFWQTHYPPNGWGCKCGVVSVSEREVQRLIDQGVPIRRQAPEINYRDWTNKKTGEVLSVPVGIDPGWDYNVGIDGFKKAE